MGERKHKPSLAAWLIMFLLASSIASSFPAFIFSPVQAQYTPVITIKNDGSIDPPNAPVQQNGNVYLLTANITLPDYTPAIRIQKGGIVIDGNGFAIRNGYATAVFEFDSSYYCRNVVIRNVITENCTSIIDANGSGGPNYQDYISGMTLTNNRFTNGTIIIWWTNSINITNNEFVNAGIGEGYVSNCAFTKNKFSDNSNFGMMYSSVATNALVTDNEGSTLGFSLGGLRNAFVSNNTLVGPATYDSQGITAFSSTNVTIKGNNLANFGEGISASQIPGCVVSENKVSNSVNNDLWVSECNGAQISKNILSGKGVGGNRGIYTTSNCTIWDNVISNHKHGITIGSYPTLPFCKIYHNHIINNTYQARIDSGTKPPEGVIVWDDGYPSGGNFWSDYTGVDYNYDGIGDSPYIFKGSGTNFWEGRDRFPLTSSPYYGLENLIAFFNYTLSPDYLATFDGSLSSASNSTIVRYEWKFGDGATDTGMMASHKYTVGGGAQSIAWTSISQTDPAFSATLKVTDNKGKTNEMTRTVSKGNFIAREIMPVQAYKVDPSNEFGLVQEKATDFWIQVESTFSTSMKTSIKIDLVGFAPDAYEFNYTFNPGWNEFYVGEAIKSSPFFRPWTKPAVSYRFIIDPYNLTPETEENDNVPPANYAEINVTRTKSLRILFVPVRFKNEDGYPGRYTGYSAASLQEHAAESMAYIRATYPIADPTGSADIGYSVSCTNSPVTAKNYAGEDMERPITIDEAEEALVSIAGQLAGKGTFDRVVGVVRTNWFVTIPGFNTVRGYMIAYNLRASVTTLENWAITPHEIGHSYNLTDTNYRDDGYYVLGRTEINDAQTWMSSSAIAQPPPEPKLRRPVPYFWVSDTQYLQLFDSLRIPNDPEILSFCADFWQNGTVRLGNMHRYPEGFPDHDADETGNYSLVQLDGSNNVLSVVGFNVAFEGAIDEHPEVTLNRVPIAFTTTYANGTKTIQVRDKLGTVVASKTVSANPPSVHVTSPNGGQILKSQTTQISWEASDLDGDTLTYDLLVSGDGGATWDPVATGLKQKSHNLILTGFSGGDKYLVKVIACDGVNTAEDVSDSFFTIASFTATMVSVPQMTRARDSGFYLLNITSYGGFSDQITLNATSSTTNRLNFTWSMGTSVTPVVNGSTYVQLQVQTLTQIQGGNHTLYLLATSGNNTEVAITYLYVEPFGSIRINDNAAYTNSTSVTLELTSIETTWGQVRFSNNGVSWSSWEDPAYTKDWTLTTGEGAKTVYYLVQDDKGLTETYNDTIVLDTTPPVARAGQNQAVLVGTSASFNGNGSTDNNAVAEYLWDFGDGTTGKGVAPSHTYSTVGTYTVKLTVKDAAGNSGASSATVSIEVMIPEFTPIAMLAALMALSSAILLAFRKKRSHLHHSAKQSSIQSTGKTD